MTRASTFAKYSLAHALAREGAKPGGKEAHARLDAGAMVRVSRLPGGGCYGEDDGPGRLDGKMAAFGKGKLVPPPAVLIEDLSATLKHRLHRQITDQILREAAIERRVAAALADIGLPAPEDLREVVQHALAEEPNASWRAAVAQMADRLLAAPGCAGAALGSKP
jgi:hypothetical protein